MPPWWRWTTAAPACSTSWAWRATTTARFDRAIEALRRATVLDAKRAETQYLLGLCLAQQEQRAQAAQALERALALDPTLVAAREAIVQVYEELGRSTDALRETEALARVDPDRPERLAAVGLAMARAGRTDDAVVALAKASERFPDDPVLLEALGHVWLRAGEARQDRVALGKAVEALRRATERTPNGNALAMLGRAWLVLGEPGRAMRPLQAAVSRLPVAPDTFDWLADAAEALGRVLAARDALVRADSLVGDRQEARGRAVRARRIAALSGRAGETDQEIAWLERALALQPQDTELRQRIDEAKRRKGRRATPPAGRTGTRG